VWLRNTVERERREQRKRERERERREKERGSTMQTYRIT